MSTTLTLTGYLGADREIGTTRERTVTRRSFDPIVEQMEEHEVTLSGREFIRLSMATQQRRGGRWQTRWHRLICWNTAGRDCYALKMARKGDRVRVTGRQIRRSFTNEAGERITYTQVVVEEFHLVRIKARAEAA